ncbi:hypothetical protein STK_23185 [Sulfurisphaera tokodaii str. 7]|uniref:Uncharacterized protein n=2 Tax=Sulfurisphaera tokodaii TaxID=111955 RepID=Q96Y48_SULTO|nr:hypothetical protein STK_23185 [Sulfurisphaera tokodaii str. 7]
MGMNSSKNEEIKNIVEKILKEREWITFSDLIKYVNFPASEVNSALVQLMRENKVIRKGRYFYYQG